MPTFTCPRHGKFYRTDFCPYCPAPIKTKRSSISATTKEWTELCEYLLGDIDNMDSDNEMKPVLRKWCDRISKAAARAS